jgi:phenolic acid decarboxylase
MKVLEIKGYQSLRAFQAYNTLLLGLKMLPAYIGESYESFYTRMTDMAFDAQEKMIREAAFFVELRKEEVEALVCFCTDKNGIQYSSINVGNLGPKELIEAIVSVCVEISKFKIDLVSEDEKKKYRDSQST